MNPKLLSRFGVFQWPPAPTGKAFCAFRLLPVRSLCIRPLLIPRKSASTRSTERLAHRIKYAKVDADTGEEVSNDDIMKGYKVDTDTYIEVSKDELENIALESTRTIDINEFASFDTSMYVSVSTL